MLLENPTPDSGDVSTQNPLADEAASDVLFDEIAEVVESEQSEQVTESDDGQASDGISLSEFAENLGLDENDLDVDDNGKVVFKTKIDGKEGRLTPAEFKTAYQKQGHLDNLIREEKSKLEAVKAREMEVERQSAEKLQHLEDAYNLAWQELNADYNKIDWQALREDQPEEFAAKQVEFNQRNQRIQTALYQAQQVRHQKQQEMQAKFLAEQERLLKEMIPEWNDETVGRKEISEIQEYGEKLGFTAAEMAQSIRAPFLVAMRKAKKFDELESSKPEISKQVKKARKVASPGTSQKKEAPKRLADILYS